jgi:leucyl/phenylalanyl-tRNA--protein transferase
LHGLGWAHSFESWRDGEPVGGLYGVAIGRVFFGESMFARATDASKVAVVRLAEHLQVRDFGLIDCQVASRMSRASARPPVSRADFLAMLDEYCEPPGAPGAGIRSPVAKLRQRYARNFMRETCLPPLRSICNNAAPKSGSNSR